MVVWTWEVRAAAPFAALLWLAGSSALLVSSAAAQEADTQAEAADAAPDPEARLQQAEQDGDARLHYELAVRALRRGEFEEAAGHFDEAYQLSHRPEMLYNSYLAWRDAQDRPRAIASLRVYLAQDAEMPDRERLQAVLTNMEREEAEAAAQAPEPASEVDPVPDVAPLPEPESTPPIGGIVLTALGGATLIAAAVTGGVAIGAASDLEASCPGDVCPGDQAGAIDGLRTVSLVTDVLWPLGAALAVGGLVWIAVELSSDSADVAQAARVELALGAGHAQLRGSF